MHRTVIALLAFTAFPLALAACLWDYDTLKMERQRFPGTLEIITGKFLRHSQAFYEWRVKDRLAKLNKKQPHSLDWYDDLAVAYDKLGQTDKAVEVMLKKDKLKPGEYKTHANLSAFYMLSGQWEKGLEHVNKALAIDPNAHFGREKYQKLLAEYVLSKMKDGKLTLPMAAGESRDSGFHDFFVKQKGEKLEDAIKGVSGMLHFARPDSPVLLEALGDLLLAGRGYNREEDAKQLAARAYLRASDSVQDATAREGYLGRASFALTMQIPPSGEDRGMRLDELKTQFQKELAEGDAWIARIEADEKRWIAEGKDPEKEFDRTYYQEPSIAESEVSFFYEWRKMHYDKIALVIAVLLGLLSAPFVLFFIYRRRLRRQAAQPFGVRP